MYKVIIGLLSVSILSSCALQPKPDPVTHTEPVLMETDTPLRTPQEMETLDIFSKILDLVETADDRRSVLPRIEELYRKIMKDYPETPLAQESHLRLISIYVDDYDPPDFSRAGRLHSDFLEKYPSSAMRNKVENALGKAFGKHAQWQSLLKLSTPAYKEYLEKGTSERPSLLFMYAEANYHLSNNAEAENAYEIVSRLFPNLVVGQNAKSILMKMKENKK